MEIDIKLLKIQNQWWDGADLKYDPVISALSETVVSYRPKIMDEVKFRINEVSVVQGSRGVGKTTAIKLFIKELIEDKKINPQDILYYSCHNLNSREQLNEIIKTFISWRRTNKKNKRKLYIFIDEVTLLKGWEQGLTHLESAGLLDSTSVLLSGSVYSELKISNHSLKWKSIMMQSLSFRELLVLLDADFLLILDKNKSNFAEYKNRLEYYLDIYFLTGGYVSAINSFLKEGAVKQEIYSSYLYWLIADVARMRRDLVLFRQILEQVINFQGQSFGFQTIAKRTKAQTHNTVAAYIRMFQSMFVAQTVYQLQDQKTINRRAAKRMYFRDPFIFWVFYAYTYGSLNYWQFSRKHTHQESIFKVLIDNVVFAHLLKQEKIVGWEQSLAYWREAQTKIEFPFIDINRRASMPIMMRYNKEITEKDMLIFKQAGFNKGIIISRDILEPKGRVQIMPLVYFLLYY